MTKYEGVLNEFLLVVVPLVLIPLVPIPIMSAAYIFAFVFGHITNIVGHSGCELTRTPLKWLSPVNWPEKI